MTPSDESLLCLLLVEPGGKLKLVFKFSFFFLCGIGIHYFDIPLDKADVLRRCLDEAEVVAGVKSGGKKVASHVENLA
jgi:hypothetical protein